MPLKDHDKRAAIADKYGWRIGGWAVDLDNIAGISLWSKWDSSKHIRFQHKDSLAVWESTLKANAQKKPRAFKEPPKPKTWDDLRFALKRIVELEPGSKGAYGKFVEAQKIAKAALS